jgi:hyperosmotically inducible protein
MRIAMVALLVAPACSDRTADETKRGADKAVDAGKAAADKVAETTREVATATGAAVTDGWITAKLKAKFADEVVLKGSDISVETNDHTGTLTGSARSAAARSRALEIANGTEGVRQVVNQLVVP